MNPFKTWMYLMIPLLWLNLKQTQCEVYSLIYTYTAFSKPVDLPGIHEFTAIRQLDDWMLEYYDSVNQKLVPKQTWMEERLPSEYWVNGTRSCQHEQQWFKDTIDILMKTMEQNDTETHILQGMQGCEGDMLPDGTLQFKNRWDMYNYDGNDIQNDYINGLWVDQGEAQKERDGPQYIQRQLECKEWLSKFIIYEQQLQTATPPNVFLFAKNAKVSANAVLVCLATGFYPKDVELQIRKDGRLLEEDDGVISSGVRPNGINETFQRRDEVEIVRADDSQFTCEVSHKTSNVSVLKVWDHVLPTPVDPNVGAHIGAVAGVVVLSVFIVFAVVIVVLHKIYCSSGPRRGSVPLSSLENRSKPDALNVNSDITESVPFIVGENASDQSV